MMNTAVVIGSTPWLARAINTPMVAEELCNTRVIKRPIPTPINGLLPYCKIQLVNSGNSFNGCKAELKELIPINKIPNPIKISLASFTFGFLVSMLATKPAAMTIGAHCDKLKETICPVIVVPTFAPKTTPTACANVIKPAFTKPTTITVVADEL